MEWGHNSTSKPIVLTGLTPDICYPPQHAHEMGFICLCGTNMGDEFLTLGSIEIINKKLKQIKLDTIV